ncbi:uncharacterized protein LOC129766108 [Toxorhynchites rutilus septentrionalis]|uniref:uncharacterized protein LOC129766108 n=1 Tax=Toxorhynchites rutilus septentrionalis TaxID=329112 RepID=UPI002478F44D|nr:uncharacterized protein LOC129766108 [Toxorhynchites rutilus septentrionalis]
MAERNSAKKKLAVATEEENSVNVISELEHTKDNIVDSLGLLEFYVQEFDKTEKIQGQVGAWAEKLEQFYDDYHRVVAKLESFSTEEEPVDLKGERIDFATRYYALRAFYMSKLKKSSGSASVNPPPPVRPLNIRLPELILPKFSGKLEDWCVFRDSFESAVGSRDDISAVEKMHYLKGLVHGEAARILDPIKISEQGYKDAWRSLRLRFENKRQLIKCHIKTLFDTPTMRKESAEELLTLVDRFEQQISVLKNLGEPADRWSSLLVYLLSVRLDPSTLREWENHCAKLDADNIAAVLGGTARDFDHINEESTAMPSYVSMVNYLQNYARVLQAVSPIVSQSAPRSKPPRPLPPPTKFVSFPAAAQSEPSSSAAASVIQSSKPCVKCGQAHYLYQCPEFRKMTVTQRSELVRRNRLCMNCMRSNSHYARTCSAQRCRVCSKKHHTLLHLDSTDSGVGSGSQSNTSCCVALQQQNSSAPQAQVASVSQTAKSATTVAVQQQSPSTSNNYNVNGSSGNPQYALVTHSAGTIPEAVFLPTAMVNIRDSRGRVCTVRCLLDCASQRSFVSKAACDRLQLPRIRLPNSITVSGIGNATTSVEYQSTVTIFSRVSPFTIKDTMLVLPSITVKLPQSTVDTRHWSIPRHLDLADPTFAVTGNIDIILGAAHFLRVLRYGRISLGDDLPLLQSTEFGWVVSGKCVLSNHDHSDSQRCQFSNPCTINELVHRFWQLEEIQNNKGWSPSERYCEEHFTANTVRNADGRYVVRLPKREELLGQLRDNRYNATKRFYGLERSLAANPMKKALYQEFIREYLNLGHMYEVKSAEEDLQPQYFLPHHAVMKPESTTTKMRVVFDASCRSKSGLSLNDVLLSGPTIQDTLVTIVLRFRFHNYVVSADIEKMYRQVLVHESDQPFQRILWRDDPVLPLKVFQLRTVTYGTSSAPFLATRVLSKLADDEEKTFPLAASAVRHDFYVDNLLTGSDNAGTLASICREIIAVLESAGLPLRQWSSNSEVVLNGIPPELRDTATLRDLDDDFSVTALGLRWEPETDNLLFKTPKWKEHATPTKRTVLSDISSLFDPLGLIGPTIARAKIKLQGLWKLQLDWDTPVPDQFAHDWTCFRQKLIALVHVRVPRHVLRPGYTRLEIHGFSDASEDAYGACIYLRSVFAAGTCTVRLLSAKSKVAPIQTTTIPRLELCAAQLLSRLLTKVLDSVDVSATTYLWTDSTIVLNWILATPSTWKTFVANRVAEIQELTSHAVWHHVPSEDNPADLISRGKDLDELLDASLWWNGPTWLHSETSPWPETVPYSTATTEILETRKTVALPVADQEPPDIIDRYHSIRQVLRVAALLWRFCENCRRHAQNQPLVVGPLTPEDIDHALLMLIRRVQGQCFDIEIRQLTSSGQVDRKSKLRFLHPQIVDGIIRVGGRLHFARIPIDERHPIVLPANHRLTEMICRREHLKTLHAGPGLLLSSLRQRFWPLGGRNLVRKVVHRCVTCTRAKPQSLQQLMGNLPPVRVNQAYPFQNVGVDLAGPFYVRTTLRNKRTPFFKAYIVVYVCMATKAAHLDLVTDLTTAAFIASLRRFVSRRGKPSHIFCDNATNFVGAQRELGELRKLFQSQHHQDAVARECTDDGIEFHFIPPRSPSFGGIWEACVKSAKMHLRRILGNAHLTETELQTALCQVEAMLNSRPITPMPGAPTDELSLTPGHFLIGRPLNAMPDPDKTSISENRLSRWERVQQLSQHFWNRWHTEYLTTLQHRYRWTEALDNLAVGSIVVLKDEQLPPQKWALGRVLSVHPGTDGRVRVATVKTSSGIMQRAISKLCLLPVEIDPESVSPTPELAGPSSG